MKGPIEAARTREHPHIVTLGERRLGRIDVTVSNAPIAGISGDSSFAVFAMGVVDAAGRLTPEGRRLVLEKSIAHAKASRLPRCVVWALDDCTWIDREGTHFDGPSPAAGETTMNPWRYDDMPLTAEACRTIALPDGCRHPHLCIVPIDRRRVEIVGGEHLFLGTFDEPVPDGERDPARRFLADDGTFVPPRRFRGQPVVEVDGWTLYGPVQPVDVGTVLRDPFPQQVAEACERVAGRPLDDDLLHRAWTIAQTGLWSDAREMLRAA